MSLRRDLDSLRADLLLPETEETWDRIANGIDTLTELCRNGGSDSPQDLIPVLRSLSRPLINALNSERTRLSGPATELIATAASGLGSDFDPLLPIFFPALLLLCSRSNKVVVARAKTCVLTIVQSTQLPPILSHLLQHSRDKASSLRLVVAEATLACLNCFNPPDLEKESRARDIESLIRIAAKDAAAEIRKVSRDLFEAYKLLLPARVKSFAAPLSPTSKKYLDIKPSNLPGPNIRVPSHKPKSNLAASTSSLVSARPARHIEFKVQERPNSSSSCRSDFSRSSKNIELDRPPIFLPNGSIPVIDQAHRNEARRMPILTAERLLTSQTSCVSSARPATTERRVGELVGNVASSGPKRIPLPEVIFTAQMIPQTNDTPHFTPADDVAVASVSHTTQKTIKACSSKPAKPITEEQNAKGTTSYPPSKAIGVPRRPTAQRSVSQPTQSQLAKVKITTSKPVAVVKSSRKALVSKPAPRKPVSHKLSKIRELGELKRCSRSPTLDNEPSSQIQKAAVVESTEEVDEGEAEVCIKPNAECETPKKAQNVEQCTLVDKTPISALLTSIEQGFLFTPSSPLSPPQLYLGRETMVDNIPFPLRLPQKNIREAERNQLSKTERRALGTMEMNN